MRKFFTLVVLLALSVVGASAQDDAIVIENIAALKAYEPVGDDGDEVVLKLNNAQVTYASSQYDDWYEEWSDYCVLEDESGAYPLTNVGLGKVFKAGQVLNGELALTVAVTWGMVEVVESDNTAASIESIEATEGTLSPIVVTDDNIVDYLENYDWRLVSFSNVKVTVEAGNWGDDYLLYIDVLDDNVNLYDAFYAVDEDAYPNDGDVVNVTGFLADYMGMLIFQPLTIEKVVPVLNEPTFNIASGVQLAAGSTEGFTLVKSTDKLTVSFTAENLDVLGYNEEDLTVKVGMLLVAEYPDAGWSMKDGKRTVVQGLELPFGKDIELEDVVFNPGTVIQSITLAGIQLLNGDEVIATYAAPAAVRFLEVEATEEVVIEVGDDEVEGEVAEIADDEEVSIVINSEEFTSEEDIEQIEVAVVYSYAEAAAAAAPRKAVAATTITAYGKLGEPIDLAIPGKEAGKTYDIIVSKVTLTRIVEGAAPEVLRENLLSISGEQTISVKVTAAEEPDAIAGISADELRAQAYDLTGRKANALTRGIYVVNGKKLLVK